MKSNLFLFQQETWIGEGTLLITLSKEPTKFFTRWSPLLFSKEEYNWQQEVELHGLQQTNFNKLTLFDIVDSRFKIVLENESMGRVTGKGFINAKTIAWELRDLPGYEGYEVYELQENGDYLFRAEYISSDQFRTQIEGRMWKKEP